MTLTLPLRLSNSSVKTFLRCEQQYDYKYVQELEPKRSALPLKRGTWIHRLLEARYRDGSWKPEWKKLNSEYAKLWQDEKDYYGDLPEFSKRMMQGYDYHWKDDQKDWNIREVERKVQIPLGKNWVFIGKIDVEAENEEGLWLWDHKTFSGQQPSSDYRTSDPQSSLYAWAYEKITGNRPVGFVFNYMRTKLPTIPKILKRGGLSVAKNIDTNWITLARFLRENDLNQEDYRPQLAAARARDGLFYQRIFIPKPDIVIRNLLLDIQEKAPRIRQVHEGRRPVRTLTYECERMCPYHLLCITELTGGDGSYIKKQNFRKGAWTEYDDAIIEEA